MSYKGVIIEESLCDKSVLNQVTILDTKIEEVTEHHKTPWLKQWTLHSIELPKDQAAKIAEKVRRSLETEHTPWYADFKNGTTHFIIFPEKIFKINRSDKTEYEEATKYGISLGIPDYQVDFSPHVVTWKR